MNFEKIEETRKYFIEKYGEPSVKKIGNMTYKTLNQDLEAFDKFIDAILKTVELTGLKDVEKQVGIICEYAKTANPVNMQAITYKLSQNNNQLGKGYSFTKKSFVKMFEEIGEIADKKDFNPNLIANYFSTFLKVNVAGYATKRRACRVSRRDDTYFRRNPALEDNNF